MKIRELITESYDVEDDEYTKIRISDSNRPRLTLKHLNKLRKLKDVRREEDKDRKAFVSVMYNSQKSEESGGM